MATVRVPKHLRPPKRFDPFYVPPCWDFPYGATLRCKGIFRVPKVGEIYWSASGRHAFMCTYHNETMFQARVILEKVNNL